MVRFSFNASKKESGINKVAGSVQPGQNEGINATTSLPSTSPLPVTAKDGNLLRQMQSALTQKSHAQSATFSVQKLPASFKAPVFNRPKSASHEAQAITSKVQDIPPGSHYPEWVWNAMLPALSKNESYDLPTTIELYMKGGAGGLDHHVLMNVPTDSNGLVDPPWGIARRVLLIPVKYKESSRNPDPMDVQHWLNEGFNHLSVFGRCSIETPEQFSSRVNEEGPRARSLDAETNLHIPFDPLEFWVIISKKDASAILKKVSDRGEMSSFGQAITLNESRGAQRGGVFELNSTKAAISPAQRYLGAWRGPHAGRAIECARLQSGPLPPGAWSDEDLKFLQMQHSTMQHRSQDRSQDRSQEKKIVQNEQNLESQDKKSNKPRLKF